MAYRSDQLNIGMILENNYTNDERVRREAETLVKHGYKVSVLALKTEGYPETELLNNVKIIRTNISNFLVKKFRGMAVSFPLYNFLWKSKIENFIKENKIDVLHIHDLPLMPLTIKIAGRYDIPTVGDFHENYSEAIKLYYWANTFIGKILINKKKWDLAQVKAVNHLNKIIVVADETVEHFSEKYNVNKSKFIVVDNSIDVDQFNENGINSQLNDELKNKYKNHIVLGFTGAILPNRGLQHIISILPKFRDKAIKVVIVGKGKFKKVLMNKVKQKNIENMVDWYDWQPFRNLLTFTRNFDIGITRLEQNLQNDYTTPNKVFQYMYMEKPVLTADSLPMKRIVGKTESGFVFKSGNYQDLESKLRLLINNEKLRKKLGANGKKAVINRYNWDNTRKNLIELYDRIKVR